MLAHAAIAYTFSSACVCLVQRSCSVGPHTLPSWRLVCGPHLTNLQLSATPTSHGLQPRMGWTPLQLQRLGVGGVTVLCCTCEGT
jgi:hypothetical protein